MKRVLFSLAVLSVSFSLQAQTKMPSFAKLGYNKQLLYTSSKGEFEEFHDLTDVVEIGFALFNTKTNQMVGFVSEEKTDTEVSSATTAMSIDPMCEKYYWISPYAFCLNNPVRFVDPTGKDVWEIDAEGRIVNRIEDKTQDAFYMVQKDGDGNYQRTYTTDEDGNKQYNSISFEYGTVESQKSITYSPDGQSTDTYDVYKIRGDENGSSLFEFLGNNVTGSSSMVEIGQTKTGIEGEKGLNFITTGHMLGGEPGSSYMLAGRLYYGYTIREMNHSHPVSAYAGSGDLLNKSQVTGVLTSQRLHIPNFNIYHVPSKTYIPY
jgi:hypothetical protein